MTSHNASLFAVDNATLLLRGAPVEHYAIIHEIGRGANGIVFEAVNRLLDRREALKIWLALRPDDTRNKIEQGMQEARKASTAAPSHAAAIYHANMIRGVFYATMEYVDGITLKSALNTAPHDRDEEGWPRYEEGWPRLNYARAYIDALRATSADGLLHGDPHWNNVVMVRGNNDLSMEAYATAKFVDFGTSHFTAPEHFEARHWRVVEEQLDRALGCLPNYWALKTQVVFPKNRMHPRNPDYFSELMLYMIGVIDKLQ